MAALVLLWSFFVAAEPLSWTFFILFFGLAVLGEVVEFGTQIWGAKKYGSSNSSTFAGMIGAIVGAILLSPLFFGLGAVLGALLGAWLGSFAAERLRGVHLEQAVISANGALLGRFLGMVIKFGIGIAMVSLTAMHIWPA